MTKDPDDIIRSFYRVNTFKFSAGDNVILPQLLLKEGRNIIIEAEANLSEFLAVKKLCRGIERRTDIIHICFKPISERVRLELSGTFLQQLHTLAPVQMNAPFSRLEVDGYGTAYVGRFDKFMHRLKQSFVFV